MKTRRSTSRRKDEISSSDEDDGDDQKILSREEQRIKVHVKNISRDIYDFAFLNPDKARHWLHLAEKIQHWKNCSPYIFWQRFEKFTSLVEQHNNNMNDDDQEEEKNSNSKSKKNISHIPRLLGNFHPFAVMSSKPTQSTAAIAESSFPSSEKLLSAVSFLASSTDTVPLLFHIFNTTALAHRDRRLKMKSGCYHTTLNFSGIWRHTFVDSIVPLQPPLQQEDVLINDDDEKEEENENENKNTTSIPINDDKEGEENQNSSSTSCCTSCCENDDENKKSDDEKREIMNSIRRRLLTPHCKLDHRDIYLPLIQKSLAKLSGSYASSSLDIGVDCLNEIHDLTGVPIERLPWPTTATKKKNNSSLQQQSFLDDDENATLLLTSAFVQLEVAMLRHEGGRVYDSAIQPVAILTKRQEQNNKSRRSSSNNTNNIVRIIAAASAEVDPFRAQEFEKDLEFLSQDGFFGRASRIRAEGAGLVR